MVMIARAIIRQFVLLLSILFNRRYSEPVQASSSVQAFVTRSSKVGNKMVDIVNKNTWKDYFVNSEINQFSVSLRTVSCTLTKYRAIVLKIRYLSGM